MILQVFSLHFILVLLRKTHVPKKWISRFKQDCFSENTIYQQRVKQKSATGIFARGRFSSYYKYACFANCLPFFRKQFCFRLIGNLFLRFRSFHHQRSQLLLQRVQFLLLLPDLLSRFQRFCIWSYLYPRGSAYRYIRFLSGRSVDRSCL